MPLTTPQQRFTPARLLPVLLAALAALVPASADAACPPGTKAWMSRGEVVCLEPGYAPSAEDQCYSLLKSVKPASEAGRVYTNCIALVSGKGFVTCPDGSKLPAKSSQRCGK